MSDTSQGVGWWRASDGLWYPPEAKPGHGRHAESEPRRPTPPRRPEGVPERVVDPMIQEPFILRKVEPLDLDRERSRPPAGGLDLDRRERRWSLRWGWFGAIALILIVGGIGIALALTAGEQPDSRNTDIGGEPDPPSTSSLEASGTTVTTAATTTSTTAPETSVFALVPGDCFTTKPETVDGGLLVTTVEVVDCDEPHLAEVIELFTMDGDADAPFPGEAKRDAHAQGLCQPAFGSYVGTPLAGSELGLLWLAPTETTWTEEDDRDITCAVQALDGEPLIGSVAGSER